MVRLKQIQTHKKNERFKSFENILGYFYFTKIFLNSLFHHVYRYHPASFSSFYI